MMSLDTVNGILIVDKPQDWSSHDVCAFVRRRFRLSKVGHAGVLDRCATGALIVLIGAYTKLSNRFLNQSKEYEAVLELGARTSTHDQTGEVLESRDWSGITESEVRECFAKFLGPQEQLPPMASSVKLNGVRLYKLARQGKEVERATKNIEVFALNIRKINLPEVEFDCRVSKGTYVRTLANDIGLALGSCAFLKKLRRTSSGEFSLADGVTIDFLKSISDPQELKPYLKMPVVKAAL